MKKILVIVTIITLGLIGILFNYQNNNDKAIYESSSTSNNKIVSSNALTMMYETEAGSGEYQVTSDTTWPQEGYVFNEQLSACENGSELSWDDENKRVIVSTSVSDKCYVYFDVYALIFSDYIINDIYTEDGANGLYYHDGVGSYMNANQEAEDSSYRFSGADPNNYVCFGSDEGTCPADNLYRIIGVFGNQVKLIKNARIGYNYWSGSISNDNNTWSSSTLNTEILNGTYLNTLGSEWTSKIATTSWKVGGNTAPNILNATPKTAYINEIESPAEATTYNAKIGLMYVSDYGYAASPENWNTKLNYYGNATNRDNNWMFMGGVEWTISRRSGTTSIAFYVFGDGNVNANNVNDVSVSYSGYGVRPSFYLESGVTYVSGDGSIDFPFRIQ